MTTTIIKAIMTALLADSTLTTLLGGNYVYMAEIMQTNQFPSITLRLSGESAKKRVGYNAVKTRDQNPLLQCDIWSKKSRYQTYQIADEVDKELFSNVVTGTRSWAKVSDGDMYEPDTQVYHKPLRYSYEYTITDA